MTKKRDYFWWIVGALMIAVPVVNHVFWYTVAILGGLI